MSIRPSWRLRSTPFRQPDAAPKRSCRPAAGGAEARGLDALLVSDPGLPATVALNYVLPYDARPDSLAKQGDQLRGLAGAMLSRRLESLGLQPAAPFSQAGAGAFELAPAALIASLRADHHPRELAAGVDRGGAGTSPGPGARFLRR